MMLIIVKTICNVHHLKFSSFALTQASILRSETMVASPTIYDYSAWRISSKAIKYVKQNSTGNIGAGSGVPGGAQAPPELFLAPPEPFEPPLTIKTIMH